LNQKLCPEYKRQNGASLATSTFDSCDCHPHKNNYKLGVMCVQILNSRRT
jgi:hypothetical protein